MSSTVEAEVVVVWAVMVAEGVSAGAVEFDVECRRC